MKTLTILITSALLLLTGCVNFEASQTFFDPELKITVTNHVRGNFMLAQSAVKSLEVAKRTKTTSSLVSAKDAQTDGGVAMMEASTKFMEAAVAAGAKGASKAVIP